ncbi:hypothetical protein ACQV2E_20825 [Pantoea allii]|uniref:Uncharacterized protein n=1 Tax=Pantoea allii TaxID=574096 RepID=A0ABS6VK65_9GAMM|nr:MULTISPECIES: hypothetical protein [Pantoea]MBW1215810.1 hypothetical protein [Pantoea allii]MBW1254619.1 hypothetical protein [Pantoea allii]MBW1259446.1 hypothetical protein [Pantoea allii]MBW1263721.1 hypothetical protein [Pantoea allii]MBW1268508.1 hypothetical protein [Pantoea allii]
MNNSNARLIVFLLTFLVVTLNLVAVYIMLRMGVGPSGGITWQVWRMLNLLAWATLGLQVLSLGSGLSMAPVFAGLVTWLIVPAGWLVEVARAGQLQVASKAFLYMGPCTGVVLSFGAAVFVLMFERRRR